MVSIDTFLSVGTTSARLLGAERSCPDRNFLPHLRSIVVKAYGAAQRRAGREFVASTQGALDQANARYQSGLVTYLEVASTENAALTARLTVIETEARRFRDSVLLIKALGGDWNSATGDRQAGRATSRSLR